MYQNKEWFNSKEIKNKIFNLLLDYSNGSLFIHHIIPFITKNDLFLNFYLTCKKIAILIQQQITYNVILNLNEDNLLSVMNIYLQDKNKPLIVKEFIENGLSTGTKKSWDFLEGKKLDFCKTFPSILHFVNGLKIDVSLISEIDYYGQSRLTFNDFRDFIIQFYKYTFLLNHKSNVKYFIFNQSGYYDQERNLERFKLLFIEDLANLFKNNDCNKQSQHLLNFKCTQDIHSYGYFFIGEQLAQIIIDFQKVTSLQNLTVTSRWGAYLNKFANEMAKICDKNIFNNLKKLKLNCGNIITDYNSYNNLLEKLNETKVVIKSENLNLAIFSDLVTVYNIFTKSNIYFSGNIIIRNINNGEECYNNKDYQFDIVKFLESLQRSDKIFSLQIIDCNLYTTTNRFEKLFNFKNLTTFECINTTIKKYNNDGTETIITKEFLDNFKFQKLKLIKLEKLNLNEIPKSLNNLNLNQISLANNKIENINNLNLQNNLFIDIQNNNIKDISILNNYRYINLLNNPILQNKNIGFYNNNYFLIDNKEILFKKYFQNNLMELYLFNYMQFVKVLKKKNSKNSKIPILSNSFFATFKFI
ncbi:hypothetical protein ABK040_015223 [Willaertia magna]